MASRACAPTSSPEYRERRLLKATKTINGLFAEVPTISCSQLRQNLANSSAADTILVDARSELEMAVSIIPSPNTLSITEFEARKDAPKDVLIVSYCTVGYRSAKFTRKLRQQGYTNAKNLNGSIVAWTQKGYELQTRDGQPTKRVHVYDKKWAWQGDGYEAVAFERPWLQTIKGVLPSWLCK